MTAKAMAPDRAACEDMPVPNSTAKRGAKHLPNP